MISIFEGLSWLNQFDKHQLTKQSAFLVSRMLKMGSSKELLYKAIRMADTHASMSIFPLERAEIWLYCAAVEFNLDQFDEALQHILNAKYIYEESRERHRFAVAIWMAGIVERETLEKETGHAHWALACAIFKRLSDEYLHFFDPIQKCWRSDPDKSKWYLNHYCQMIEDLICLPEEIIKWLNKFEPSHLSEIAQQVKQLLLVQLRKKQYTSVYHLVGELKNFCKGCCDYLEIPEIMIECALVLYELGNFEEAVEILNQAVPYYTPHTHHQAVLLWFLGALMWRIPAKYTLAISNWEKAISYFSDLSIKADYEGRVTDSQWYRGKMAMMLKILNRQLAKEFTH